MKLFRFISFINFCRLVTGEFLSVEHMELFFFCQKEDKFLLKSDCKRSDGATTFSVLYSYWLAYRNPKKKVLLVTSDYGVEVCGKLFDWRRPLNLFLCKSKEGGSVEIPDRYRGMTFDESIIESEDSPNFGVALKKARFLFTF